MLSLMSRSAPCLLIVFICVAGHSEQRVGSLSLGNTQMQVHYNLIGPPAATVNVTQDEAERTLAAVIGQLIQTAELASTSSDSTLQPDDRHQKIKDLAKVGMTSVVDKLRVWVKGAAVARKEMKAGTQLDKAVDLAWTQVGALSPATVESEQEFKMYVRAFTSDPTAFGRAVKDSKLTESELEAKAVAVANSDSQPRRALSALTSITTLTSEMRLAYLKSSSLNSGIADPSWETVALEHFQTLALRKLAIHKVNSEGSFSPLELRDSLNNAWFSGTDVLQRSK